MLTKPEVFVLAVMTHPEDAAPRELAHFVKYRFWLRQPVELAEARGATLAFLEPIGQV